MATSKKQADYTALSQELEMILERLQSEDTPIDESLKLYERGLTVVKELEAYLQTAENKISQLQSGFKHPDA